MITSENSPLYTIEQNVRQLAFDQLLDIGRLNLYLYRKLCVYAGLRTVDDLCQQYTSVQDFSDRNKGAGKRAANELLTFLMSIEANDIQPAEPTTNSEYLTEITFPTWSPDIASLSLVHLHREGLISNILFNKLYRDAKLQMVGDFFQQFRSIAEFQWTSQSVGAKVVSELTVFFENLSKDPAPYIEAVEKAIEKEKDIYLPFDYCDTDSIAENFKRVVADIKRMLTTTQNKTDHHYAAILEYFFTDTPIKRLYKLEEVGSLLNLTGERVRQLKAKLVANLDVWLQGTDNELVPKCLPVDELKERLKSFFDRLTNRFSFIATEAELQCFFAEEQMKPSDLDSKAVDLLLEIYGISRCGKTDTNFTSANFYSIKPEVDHKSFLATADLILEVLRDEVVPIYRNELILRVNKSLKAYKGEHSLKQGKIPHHFIDMALTQLPEIETLAADSEQRYQIRYRYLSSNTDRAERILYELGGRQSFPKILAEMQTRADIYQLDDTIEEISIRNQLLRGSGRVRAHGKLGLYEWVSPEDSQTVEAHSRIDLVKSAIKSKGEATTLIEIEQYVNAHLTAIDAVELQNIKSTSAVISYLINRGELVRLKRSQYILKIWEPRYINHIDPERSSRNTKGKIRAEVINILLAAPDQTMPRRVLSRRLLDAGYPRPTITSTIANNVVLDLFEKDNVWFVHLKDNHNDFIKPPQQDQILKSMTDLLLNVKTHTLPLQVVVRKLKKEFSLSRGQFPVVYKIVSANPHLFAKSEPVSGQKLLTLLAAPKAFDVSFEPNEHWPELKNKLIEKLTPRLNGILIHSLDDILDVFFNVAMLPTCEADLEALDLLPGFIWKFFLGMADEHFEHSLVREVATSIEPYLLKVLFLTTPAQFQLYQTEQNKGLSRINYLLSRVQYAHSQRLRDAFITAKRTRDAAAHTAQSWSSAERSDRVLACITQILYTVNCYFRPLQSCVLQVQ